MKKNTFRKGVLLTVTLLSLASCGGGEGGKQDEHGRDVLRIFMNGGQEYDGIKKDAVWQEIEEKSGVSLQIEGANHNSDYYSVLNPMINTGDVPDVIFAVPNAAGNAYNNWVTQDVVWNIDELLAEEPGAYPYLEKILKSDQFKNLTFGDGAHTLIPYFTSNSGWGIYYRADWLIATGHVNEDGTAKVPETIEEFQEVLKDFTEKDPDGNGKNDTFGLSPSNDAFFQNPLYHAFGVKPDYELLEDGTPTYMFINPKFKNYLNWMRSMISAGYVDKQFPTNSNYQDRNKFYDGQVGILITNAEAHVTYIADNLYRANPKAKIVFGKAPIGTKNLGEEGAGGFSDWGGYWGGYSISKDCAHPEAALRLFNYLYSPEGSKTRCYGLKGTHWDYDSEGNVVPNLDNRSAEMGDIFNGSKIDGVFQPTGYYKMGASFSNDVDWDETSTNFQVRIDPNALDKNYADLIQEALDKNTLCRSNLTNITGFYPSFRSKMKKVEDASEQYAIQAMVNQGTSVDDYYSQLLERIEQSTYGWSSIQAMIKEVAAAAGIK